MTPVQIASILLQPIMADSLDLLSSGVCGSRPPLAYKSPRAGWVGLDVLECTAYRVDGEDIPGDERAHLEHWPCALVLAWAGAPVTEGMDRWFRVFETVHPNHKYHHPIRWAGDMDDLLLFFRAGHWSGSDLGALIRLDADGREVTP